MKKDKTLYLIDGSGFIFRAFYALPPMTSPDGTPVNAVYGFCNMMQKLLSELKADHIGVIFDAARKTFRNEIYPEYKAHRPPPPEDLVPQFVLIREATQAFGIPSVELENYEADDLIATYARVAEEEGYNTVIVSSDKDLMQLIRPGVELYDSMKSISIGPEQVMEKFGVPPEKVIDVQALAGDSTDNIPGIPGIGVKTAAQLINEYGNVENLLANVDKIKQPKRREIIKQNAELARISKRLVTLDNNTPLPRTIGELHPHNYKVEELVAFLQKMGFRSILARMNVDAPKATEKKKEPSAETATPVKIETAKPLAPLKLEYELIQDAKKLRPWVDAARAQGYIAIDTETTSLTPSTTKLVGVSLAIAPGKACYIPIGHVDPKASQDGGFAFGSEGDPKQIKAAELVRELGDLFTSPSVIKIAHNLKFDMQVLEQIDLPVAPYDDTMLLSYVLEGGLHGHGLDELALLHLKHKTISYEDVAGTGKNRITFDRVPLEKATEYAAEDADIALRLWLLLKPRIAQQNLSRIYERIERPLIPVVAMMERNGIKIDPAILRQQSSGLAKRLQTLEAEIHGLSGHPFNVASPKQLGDVLFAEMGLPGGAKGKTGTYSTSHDVLEPLADMGHEIVAKVLDWRGLAKLKSTYTDSLPEQIDAKTGRIHTSFSLVGAATGRLSSTDPNLQNIPIRTEDGRAIRRAFIAADGYELISVDYSQIELRLVAEVANIQALLQAFRDGIDIHALTASQVFNIPLPEMTSEKRRQAKAINFGIIYGISGFGLAKQIGCTPGEANEFIRKYLDRFYELRNWMEDTKNFAREHGYVETLFGRRVHIPGIREKAAARRGFAERQSINAPLQGTAADIMKRAMIRMPNALQEAKLSSKLLLQVHDELVFETPSDEIEETMALVKRIMEEAPLPSLKLKVPLVAEASHAKNWADAH